MAFGVNTFGYGAPKLVSGLERCFHPGFVGDCCVVPFGGAIETGVCLPATLEHLFAHKQMHKHYFGALNKPLAGVCGWQLGGSCSEAADLFNGSYYLLQKSIIS